MVFSNYKVLLKDIMERGSFKSRNYIWQGTQHIWRTIEIILYYSGRLHADGRPVESYCLYETKSFFHSFYYMWWRHTIQSIFHHFFMGRHGRFSRSKWSWKFQLQIIKKYLGRLEVIWIILFLHFDSNSGVKYKHLLLSQE